MKKLIFIVIAVVLLLTAGGIAAYAYYYNANNYVATVAGEKVTRTEFNFFLGATKMQMESASGKVKDEKSRKEFWATNIEGENAGELAKKTALEQIKEFKILQLKAKENKFEPSKEELTQLENNLSQMIAKEGQTQFEQNIKAQFGVNLEEYKKMYMTLMPLYNSFTKNQVEKVEVSDKDLKADFDKNKNSLIQIHVRHILKAKVKLNEKMDKLPDAEVKANKKKAEELYEQVKAGKDIAELAKKNSDDTKTGENGGLFEFSKGSGVVKEFEDWCTDPKRKPGDVTIVETKFGWHVIKFESVDTFDSLKDKLKKNMQMDNFQKQMEKWKNDAKYAIQPNKKIIDSIKVE